ncbi:MAG: anhydro-N-acetylmuramic acid kinase [Candidatus Obscuribacterales bacterium]|nr:anhydro-N-acetylmuramic acid kinase [Candidatus Obscuribacterales bacterium]
MKNKKPLLSIGVMTGNSLDGADAVLTAFADDGSMQDLKAYSLPSPPELSERLRQVRKVINDCHGDMQATLRLFDQQPGTFDKLQTSYLSFVSQAVKNLLDSAGYEASEIDLLGFHGQTCAHMPPSISRSSDPQAVYTCQIGDGQTLADLTGITVVYDFRSDDLMNGGEAAPLAPVHHQHLAAQAVKQGKFPLAFCNAGNTSNLSVISKDKVSGAPVVIGWDAGPFNNYPDKLVQKEKGEECDRDGRYGKAGRINTDLLKLLFDKAVITGNKDNFLLLTPPKSSDPQWYRLLPELEGLARVNGETLSFVDRLHTAEYFAAYVYMHALTLLPANIQMPHNFALCGGGWKNPISRQYFTALLQDDLSKQIILPEHRQSFELVRKQFAQAAFVSGSEDFGFDGTAMEARIFADAAVCRLKGEPFSLPSTTGARTPTIAGLIRFPQGDENRATTAVLESLDHYQSRNLTVDRPDLFDQRWSRASAGWSAKRH